ncbi:MAG: arylsulfatase [Pirellulaceae bacterium]|nr:arylsulfatase [Pirellulaceae bacterium]
MRPISLIRPLRPLRDFALLACLLLTAKLPAADAPPRPNIVIILADDLGYSDLGCYGGEIQTPGLDALAKGGLRFTQFYNTARCWPTRAALLTGYYPQAIRRDTLPGIQSGSGGTRPPWAKLLPDMLRPLGYRSYHSGKWHIDGKPTENGFDHSYLLQDAGRYFSPKNHLEDDKPLPQPTPGSGYYSTTAIANHALKCLREHAAKHADQPFFSYVAFLAPHFPLHALPEDIARYKDKYKSGWEAVRQARWERIQMLGLVKGDLSAVEHDIGPPYDFPDAMKKLGPGEVNRPLPWSDLTKEQQQFQAAKMAIHAAMVDRMDREIGRIIAQLKEMKQLDNTLLFFLSDNGASAEIMVRDDGHDQAAEPGSANTHLCLGPGWSSVANTPFRRHKTWVHEGGISTPLIVHWPAGIKARGELRYHTGHVVDLAPTILAAAQRASPSAKKDDANPTLHGKSLLALFKSDDTATHNYLWWSHEGNRALRLANWKLVAAAKQPWELYDLTSDRSESANLAEKMPDKVAELAKLWEAKQTEFQELAKP